MLTSVGFLLIAKTRQLHADKIVAAAALVSLSVGIISASLGKGAIAAVAIVVAVGCTVAFRVLGARNQA